MQLKVIAINVLILLMCFILPSCALSVEETFIPDASQDGGDIENPDDGTDVDEPDNPGGGEADKPDEPGGSGTVTASARNFTEALFDMYGTGFDGFRTGDRIYSILRNMYNDGAQGHFSATVTSASTNSFTIRVDDAVLLFDDGQVVVEDSFIVGSSPLSEYALQQFIQRHLDYVMRNGMDVTNSDYIRLERKTSGDNLYVQDSEGNFAQFTVDSFELTVESEDRKEARVAMKASLSGAGDVAIEAEGDSFFAEIKYFQIGLQTSGSPGVVMYNGPSMVIDGQFYYDTLGPDKTGIMLNYEPGDTVHIEFNNYWFENTGSYLTGTIDAKATTSDIVIVNANYTMDGCIVNINNDEVTFGGSGPLYGNWTESICLGYTKRLVNEAAMNLDSPQIVNFSHSRNFREPETSYYLPDMDYISRDFKVEKCTLTRDKSEDEIFELILTSSDGGRITLSAKNGVLTDYSQERGWE